MKCKLGITHENKCINLHSYVNHCTFGILLMSDLTFLIFILDVKMCYIAVFMLGGWQAVFCFITNSEKQNRYFFSSLMAKTNVTSVHKQEKCKRWGTDNKYIKMQTCIYLSACLWSYIQKRSRNVQRTGSNHIGNK